MTRFETPGQVVLLFAGAAVVSVILVALLNVEARNRKIKEPEIQNGNVVQVLGKKIMGWARRLRHSDSGGTLTRVRRGLKSIRDDGNNKVEHPLRHHGKHRRRLELNVTANTATEENSSGSSNNKSGNQTDGPVTRHLEDHQLCYNTNQVLLIIAVTCAVNFAFIFVVMTLVHLCNRSPSTKLGGLDSLVLVESGDTESQERKLPRHASSYSSVQEYVNSLPGSFERTASMLSLHSMRRSQDSLLRKTYSMEDLLFPG